MAGDLAAYGLLSALMIVMALVATLVVLPSVLVLITRDAAANRSLEPTSDRPDVERLHPTPAA